MKLNIETWLETAKLPAESRHLFDDAIKCYKAEAFTAGMLMSYLGFLIILKNRIMLIFQEDGEGNRPVFGPYNWFYKPEMNGLVQFYEYFHGDSSRGLGASHQTGWTALVADLIKSNS